MVNYDQYLEIRNNKKTKLLERKITPTMLQAAEKSVTDIECSRHQYGELMAISPICFIENKLPLLTTQEAIDLVRDDIDAFDKTYDLNRTYFEYEGSNPIFNHTVQEFSKYNDHSLSNRFLLLGLAYKDAMILVPKEVLAVHTLRQLNYYAVRKDLSNQGACARQNYYVALNAMDGYQLKAGEEFNINKHISYLPGYCKYGGNHPFYGGSCGASTQLYRIGLLHPDIEITERENHSERRVQYYAEYIYGDDAGIYGDFKRLSIKNTHTDPITFKILKKGQYNYFVAISTSTSPYKTAISKIQT